MNPVQDFEAMIAVKDAQLLRTAVTGLQDQLQRFLKDGSETFHFEKGVDCLKALRRAATAHYLENDFNTFLTSLRDLLTANNQAALDAVKAADIKPISSAESSSSTLSPVAADAFYAAAAPAPAPVPVAAPAPADDDLFDDMD